MEENTSPHPVQQDDGNKGTNTQIREEKKEEESSVWYSFFLNHPVASLLFTIFLIYMGYSFYTMFFPPSAGYRSAYKPSDIFQLNATLIYGTTKVLVNSHNFSFAQVTSTPLSTNISLPMFFVEKLKMNETVFFEATIKPTSRHDNRTKVFKTPILRNFIPKPSTHNLMTNSTNNKNSLLNEKNTIQNTIQRSDNFTLGTIPYFEINFMKQVVDPHHIPPQYTEFRYSVVGKYVYPVIFHNQFWLIKDYYNPINETTENISIVLNIREIGYFAWIMTKSFETSFSMYDKVGMMAQAEMDEMKRMLLETNIFLLSVTMVVSLLHSVFDFLAYKNDFQFWRKKSTFRGISVKTVIISLIIQIVVFLYLLDNDTSYLILVSEVVGIAMTFYKLSRVFSFNFQGNGHFVEYKDKNYEKSQTKQYDDVAIKYLGIACIPLCIGYSIYSLYYNEFKSWYSFVLSSFVGVIYTFGFLQMTPQLFINYKLKSVADLPWRVFIYKFLNTIVDDLFAFIIKMPLLHRIACFRDDVVFVIYLYQRWIYPVDKNRMDSMKWEDDEGLVKENKEENNIENHEKND
ncbi:hypothetical protein EIN_486890 [Entamoeba invadens IP1]|uniref:Cleft lip and palate transmembrane protein n=1 Tax=Entamoeba invadens IP1 TaxID=370355 RepID=A0A0A1U4Q2_ENTIV|nr:hypothetical protein EIN_486890 [Entamoeba invadens IP1]ELP89227.1 hypothetical protein EIN_486890 [Entamoeba invadens IP1]|eukprot:XP_004255998.1 hypothetical protein EIN_486890 [Entamoeba invadens IP1]